MRFFVEYLGPSTNAIYSGMHWAKRKKAKDDAVKAMRRVSATPQSGQVDLIFTPQLGKGVRRRDTSNNSMSAKLLEDAMVKCGMLVDDTETYVRNVTNTPPIIDRSQPTGTWIEMICVDAPA